MKEKAAGDEEEASPRRWPKVMAGEGVDQWRRAEEVAGVRPGLIP